MADSKISDLATICTIDECNDLMVIVDMTCPKETKKITYGTIKTCIKGNDIVVGTQDLWIPAGAFSVAGAGADITTSEWCGKYITTVNFSTCLTQYAQFMWHPPLNWDYSTVQFQAVWTNLCGTSCQTIDLDLAGVAFSDDDPIASASFGTAQNVTDTFTAQKDYNKTGFSSPITIGGTPTSGDSILLNLSRDVASDNLSGDLMLIGITLRISITQGTST